MHFVQEYRCHGLKWQFYQCPEHGRGPNICSASSCRFPSMLKQLVAGASQGGWDRVRNNLSLARLDERAGELDDSRLPRAAGNPSSLVLPARTRRTGRSPIHKELK